MEQHPVRVTEINSFAKRERVRGGKGEGERTGERMGAGRRKGERGKVGGRGEEKRRGTGVEVETDL